ncbi:hypothetical protein EDD36DRAFT_414842 [Exophiala viscosa]|uniref:Uncharacterized protein n=1 Tax=Exophiala viscosa TaxID=2486360 RepID=A0AAN6IHX7_9EURO|nr:hypothetical protein EDD36DRAFT_414842 [Exophiala viscosa]
MDINLTGLLYTVKLAIHYFRRQPVEPSRDRCLILKSSLAGYVDLPGSIQYNASKFGVRGVMRSLRRTTWKESIRVNLVAPWYIRTPILSPMAQKYLDDSGVGFALVEDCCRAMLLLATDTKINGSLYSDWQKIVMDTAGILQ